MMKKATKNKVKIRVKKEKCKKISLKGLDCILNNLIKT